jgi:predicted transposase YbfD/YdcC
LGQVATEEKSNEITATPVLLKQIELARAVITIDAMGCQKDIARDIVAGGGDFVIAVKDNRPKLAGAIGSVVEKHLDGELEARKRRRHETDERGHGRRDERFYFVARVPPDFAAREEWPWVKAVGTAVRVTTHADGTQSDEVRYYMLSRFLSGKRFGEAVRGHWGIESMHWVLDASLSTHHVCSPLSSRDVATCLASGNRVRGGFGFFGPRVAFRYRPRFAPRASPFSHSAIRSTDHPPISAHVSAGIAIHNPGHAPDASNAKW